MHFVAHAPGAPCTLRAPTPPNPRGLAYVTPVLTPALLKMSHVPYSTHNVNSQLTHVQTVSSQLIPVPLVNSTTQPVQTVTSQPTQSTPVNTTAPHYAQTVHIDTHYRPRLPCQPAPDPTAQQLLDTLQPLLCHRHSTLSTVNTLLRPHLHLPSPPTPRTMATLRNLLQDCPTAKHILPPTRPTRNRPNPNYDETGPQHRPLLPRPPLSTSPLARRTA